MLGLSYRCSSLLPCLDIYYQLILDKVLFFFGVVLIILYAIYPKYDLTSGLIGAGVGFLTLYGIGLLGQFLFKKEALGGGDIKLYAVVGFVLGMSNTFLSIFLAAILALIYLLFFVKDKNKTDWIWAFYCDRCLHLFILWNKFFKLVFSFIYLTKRRGKSPNVIKIRNSN